MASCLGLSVGRAHLQIVERPILYACRSAGETERISKRPGLRTCPVLQSKLKARAKEYTNPGDLQGAKATHEEQVGSEGLGVVIVDHGSRQPSSNAMLVEFVELYKQITGRTVVEPAHMELADPSILQAVGACAARGSKKVIIAPYFLSKGKHIQQDIPALVQEAQAVYPEVECVIAEPLGVDPLLVAIIDSRVKTASQNDFVAC